MKHLWITFGTFTAAWGVWLLMPWNVFSRKAALYDQMNVFLPEWAWGGHALIVGLVMIYGAVYRWPRGIHWGHIAGMYHWGLIGIFYALGDWHNTGALVSFFIVALLHMLWRESRRQVFP